MKISPVHPAAVPALDHLPIEQLAGNKTLTEDQKVTEASRQFEGVILRQILSQGRKTMFHSKLNDDSTTSGIYQDMVTGQLADAISRSGEFGLARSLQAQLLHQTVDGSSNPSKPKPKT